MSSDDWRQIDEEIEKLRKVANAIENQLSAENYAIILKRGHLFTVSEQIRRLSPMIGPAMFGALLTGNEKLIDSLDRLMRERDRLINEINREEQRAIKLSAELSAVRNRIKELENRKVMIRQVITRQMAAKESRKMELERRRREIEFLLEEYNRALALGDTRMIEELKRRLRRYGVSV